MNARTPLCFLAVVALAGCTGKSLTAPTTPGSQINCPDPGCDEICDDGIDNDADTYTDCADLDCADVCDADADDDGFDDEASGGDDCDDTNPFVNPGANEICDGVDNNCDGLIDDDDPAIDPDSMSDWYPDGDGDGYGRDGQFQTACAAPPGGVADNTDCNDNNDLVHPGAFETPGDCLDNDCDGLTGDAGCAVNLYTVRTSDAMLRKLDTTTLTWTDIGPMGVYYSFGEVAYDQGTGVMWMIDGRGSNSLYTVDLVTGSATYVGTHGITDLFGLAISPSGVIYGSGESPSGLYTLDPNTGAATLVGDPGRAADGLEWDTVRNTLIGLEAGGGAIHEIDPATGSSTVLASPGFINNCGLAHDPVDDLYWAIDYSGYLFTYDPNGGYVQTTVLSGLGAHDGLTFGP